jgi:hypothetical protein
MNHSKHVLFLALILSVFGATAGSPLRAASSQWDILRTLKPGQLIRVELNDAKSYEGALQAVNDEGITLRRAAGEQTFARKDVLRVYFKSKNHLVRNIYIGALIGVILATPVVLANNRNGWWHSAAWVWPVFVGPGAGIGAAIPTGGWHEVYHARRHRGFASGDRRPHP